MMVFLCWTHLQFSNTILGMIVSQGRILGYRLSCVDVCMHESFG